MRRGGACCGRRGRAAVEVRSMSQSQARRMRVVPYTSSVTKSRSRCVEPGPLDHRRQRQVGVGALVDTAQGASATRRGSSLRTSRCRAVRRGQAGRRCATRRPVAALPSGCTSTSSIPPVARAHGVSSRAPGGGPLGAGRGAQDAQPLAPECRPRPTQADDAVAARHRVGSSRSAARPVRAWPRRSPRPPAVRLAEAGRQPSSRSGTPAPTSRARSSSAVSSVAIVTSRARRTPDRCRAPPPTPSGRRPSRRRRRGSPARPVPHLATAAATRSER